MYCSFALSTRQSHEVLKAETTHIMGETNSKPISEIVITMTGPILGLVSSTSSIVVLNLYLKDLHVIMKNLLNVLSAHSIIASISTIAIESYVNYTNDRRLETCTMSFQAIFPSYCITCGMFSYMSVVRYYLASKMQELEAVKDWKLYLVAGIIFASEHAYIPISYLLAINFDIPSGATECAGNNGKN